MWLWSLFSSSSSRFSKPPLDRLLIRVSRRLIYAKCSIKTSVQTAQRQIKRPWRRCSRIYCIIADRIVKTADSVKVRSISNTGKVHRSSFCSGRNSINRTPDALSSMDCMDDPMVTNQAGRSRINPSSTDRQLRWSSEPSLWQQAPIDVWHGQGRCCIQWAIEGTG